MWKFSRLGELVASPPGRRLQWMYRPLRAPSAPIYASRCRRPSTTQRRLPPSAFSCLRCCHPAEADAAGAEVRKLGAVEAVGVDAVDAKATKVAVGYGCQESSCDRDDEEGCCAFGGDDETRE
uniref:Uncharacterized protein n=1 Tax=Oryza punctata TaxID=4537 RepID=A0A0E0KRT8_ORYPU